MKKKLLLSTVAALSLFAAYNTANAADVTLKPGVVDPATGKLITAGTPSGEYKPEYKKAFVDGKDENETLNAYSRFGVYDISKASVVPAPKPGDKDAHFVRLNVVDAKGNPLSGVKFDLSVTVNGVTTYFEVVSDEAGSAVVGKYELKQVDASGKQEPVFVPAKFPVGSVVKYRFVKGHATDGSDVNYVGEFAVSGDLFTNGNITINEVRKVDVTFGDKPATGKTGWVQDNQGWKYQVNSKFVTGWVQDNGKWYFFGQDNLMKKWWVKDNGTWYFLNGAGEMQTGWLQDNGTWYYLEGSGALKVNQWFEVEGKWYHVDASGALSVNTVVDGYTVNANGEWV